MNYFRSLLKTIAKSSSAQIIDQIIYSALQFLVIALLVRVMPVTKFGDFSYALVIFLTIKSFGTLGIGMVYIKNVALTNQDSKLIETMSVLIVRLVAAIVLIGVYFISAPLWISSDDVQNLLNVMIIMIFIEAFKTTGEEYFTGTLKYEKIICIKLTSHIIFTLLKCYMLFIYRDFILFIYVNVLEVASLALILVLKIHFSSSRQLGHLEVSHYSRISHYLRSAAVLTLTAVSSMLLTRIDQLMIYHIVDSSALATYALSIRFIDVLNVVQVSICTYVFVALTKQSPDGLEASKVKVGYKLIACVAIGLIVVAYILTTGFSVIFGDDYSVSGLYLMFLSPIIFFGSISNMNAKLMYYNDQTKQIFMCTIESGILNIILNLILIPVYGVYGAIFSTLIVSFYIAIIRDYLYNDLRYITKLRF